MVKEDKEYKRYALKSIKYNKVNNIFLLSVSKVCASLICSGDICPRVYVLGGICTMG